MTHISVQIPIEPLITAISTLEFKDKHKLLEILQQQIFEAEKAGYEDDDETKAEIQAVQDEFESGDYTTFDTYLANRAE
ncbi:hypothetical protein IQ260_23720 [Leptolyngbya cf. ectocarpi LEGE 11479]|uniref:Uncharacterized protein n=1 Tax=Leptolyngbya cf. ectocarpi LEGE 11479 TaxID=1828722 RepID=A0A928ZY76_LEPEC|nr:hypothetical protein [Leptolyngbya ectocarpi]MBE9069659.1 hypothetical protein [Leptolyngbya cf. ectocarpi LEGE 11479]